jgi:ABC-type polysaccharide/polyol phosphate transport system ATPase subunit
MGEFKEKGSTMVMVSHNPDQMKRYCNKGLVLHQGKQLFFGDITQAQAVYEEMMER